MQLYVSDGLTINNTEKKTLILDKLQTQFLKTTLPNTPDLILSNAFTPSSI